GVSHQRPSFFVPLPGVQIGRLEGGVQTAIQASQGAEIALPADITLAPAVFLHDYLDLTDLTSTCASIGSGDAISSCADQRVRGRSYGIEVLVRRSLTKRITGWVAYTLSRTTREAHPTGANQALQTVPGEFDRTHVVSAIGAYDFGAGWRAGA